MTPRFVAVRPDMAVEEALIAAHRQAAELIYYLRLRLDPAVVSAPFITTLVDGTGLLIYFEVDRLVLDLG